MKSRTLISLAVAATFGLSTAAFADSGHEVITPFSVSEAGENVFMHQQGFGSSDHLASVGSISDHAGGSISGSVSADSSEFSLEGMDHSASVSDDGALSGMDDGLALGNEGIYSEYYLVTWTPMTADSWDYYVIDVDGTSDLTASSDLGDGVYFLTPTYELTWMSFGTGDGEGSSG